MWRRILICLATLSMLGGTWSTDYDLHIDMHDALQSWRLDVQDTGALEELPKSMLEGDIFSAAYARAELQVAAPSADALHATHRYIAHRCDDTLTFDDVSTVFAYTQPGRELMQYLTRRNIISQLHETENYAQSCIQVVGCYFADSEDIDIEGLDYENTVRGLCEQIVTDGYDMMRTSLGSLSSMKDVNYGDDMLINAKPDDGPFDILTDIETIGNIMFSHNDPATEVHLYDVQTPDSYVDNDPHATTPYERHIPNEDEEDSLLRVPPTVGVDPSFPESIYYDQEREPEAIYTPPTQPRSDFSLWTDPAPIGGSPMEQAQLVEAIGGAADVPAASTLINPHCIEPEITEETELDVLALAELQQKHTVEYNKKLDLHTSVAIALAGKMLPELEEKYGIDPVDVLEQEGVDPRSLPDLIDEAGLEGDLLSAIEDGMRGCVDEFTELTSLDENGQEVTKKLDADAARKIVRKSISQPTALTKCVMDLLCFEVADDSGRGLYRIRGCTIPSRKSYGIVDNQRVVSGEEIVDELLNVCTSMEESGQLLEHNKTKDARDHKLMNVKFADKFSYSMSVGFKPLVDSADPAHEKRMAIENNAYLMDTLLGIDEELMHEEQRNKYVTLYNATQTATTEGINTVDQNVGQAAALQRAELGTPQLPRDMQSQLLTHPQVFEVLNEYLDQSTDHWIYMNDITHSIMQLWHAEMQESQQKG